MTLTFGVGVLMRADETRTFNCGDLIQISAHPMEDFHFVYWLEDGNTDSIRTIELISDTTFTAVFAANCQEYANWPVIRKYDWLLMLDVPAINQKGYYFSEANVSWYRAVGSIDDMHEGRFPQDDQFISNGYYMSLQDRYLDGTGIYYAVVDISSNSQGLLCDGLMRSVIVDYSSPTTDTDHTDSIDSEADTTPLSPTRSIGLIPTLADKGSPVRVFGLDPDEETRICVYSISGQLLSSFLATGNNDFEFITQLSGGCYQVQILSPTIQQVLRFIVR